MSERQLFTDLAMAERNTKKNKHKFKIDFPIAVRDAFKKNGVDSFFDLVRSDILTALKLRDMAVQENLL